MRDSEPYKIGYNEGFENGFKKAVELLSVNAIDEEQRLLSARKSLNYLPFPKIVEHFHLNVSQAKILVQQVEFAEYEKDEFDSYVEADGFFDQDSLEGIYQYRLESAKRDIVDTPASAIISSSKILSKDLKKLLIEYIDEQEKAESKDRWEGEIS